MGGRAVIRMLTVLGIIPEPPPPLSALLCKTAGELSRPGQSLSTHIYLAWEFSSHISSSHKVFFLISITRSMLLVSLPNNWIWTLQQGQESLADKRTALEPYVLVSSELCHLLMGESGQVIYFFPYLSFFICELGSYHIFPWTSWRN